MKVASAISAIRIKSNLQFPSSKESRVINANKTAVISPKAKNSLLRPTAFARYHIEKVSII